MHRIRTHIINVVSECFYPLRHRVPWWRCGNLPTCAIDRYTKEERINIEYKFT